MQQKNGTQHSKAQQDSQDAVTVKRCSQGVLLASRISSPLATKKACCSSSHILEYIPAQQKAAWRHTHSSADSLAGPQKWMSVQKCSKRGSAKLSKADGQPSHIARPNSPSAKRPCNAGRPCSNTMSPLQQITQRLCMCSRVLGCTCSFRPPPPLQPLHNVRRYGQPTSLSQVQTLLL